MPAKFTQVSGGLFRGIQGRSAADLEQLRTPVKVFVDTQRFFEGEYAAGRQNNCGGVDAGRFDMVIEPSDGCAWVAVFENKVDSGFGETQLPKYRTELASADRYKHVARKFLITLTKSQQAPDVPGTAIDGHLSWGRVHEALGESCARGGSAKFFHAGAADFLCEQFAEFLKTKGLVPMEIPQVLNRNQGGRLALLDGITFWKAAEDILKEFRRVDNLSHFCERLKPEVELYSKDFPKKEAFKAVALFNRDEGDYLCVGFQISPRFRIYLEGICLRGGGKMDDRSLRRKFPGTPPAARWDYKGSPAFTLEHPLSSPLDGNRDKILEWFVEAATAFDCRRIGAPQQLRMHSRVPRSIA